ncbi:hypothetical protein SAMN02745945_02611 [Peptoclostridium litorale DSM 5388]|uniref:Uncharacterized protein n=1 Tax=Peptoclostridium litorale DSM 5388 TaxID=1121324 RepID=A0A069RD25_PEPLI|nr:hypothetical protein [Peptoclostridium litorale]KDR94653.1 hypothetical protein CLIT_14c01140 [Peptoclostridium litorale DSM 5388]SIO30240.1 hypothetical protein SAMN02745945_02611 [Peptoclostridium litorale DSM 5388]
MKRILKRVIFNLIDRQKFYKYRRLLAKLLSFKKNIVTKFEIDSYGDNESDTFFGYYDISPFQNDKLAYISVKKDEKEADIIIRDIETGKEKTVGATSAWNWQQGSRLRWVPNRQDHVIYNDFENNQFVTKIVDISSGEIAVKQWPFYDIDYTGRIGITLDFLRLGVMRPGYGYTNLPYVEPQSLNDEGITIVDLLEETTKKVITYELISKVMGQNENTNNYENSYINHLSFSPSGNKFLFFWIQIAENNIHKANLLVYDIEKAELTVLEKELSVSHYDWIDDESIVVTAYDKNRTCRYYIYNVNGERQDFMHDILVGDGHPTWIGNGKVITDTYVDKKGYQKVLLIDINGEKVDQLVDIYSTHKHVGERRCDLHPRVDAETEHICFDADVNGHRKLYLLKGWE